MQATFFLGSCTPRGFSTFASELAEECGAVDYIKGGSGCGKSTFLRRIADEAAARGLEVWRFLCSSDPQSLDAVVLPSLGRGWVDATAPHVLEPTLCAGREGYVDFGAFYDRAGIARVEPELRRRMIGKHAAHGLAALDRLLAAGIEAHAQIVLMPGVNDGEALRETLEWAWERPGINGVGIVPLGFTKHQTALHESFTTPKAARGVIDVIAPFQQRARAERGGPWVFAADEFYVNAFGADTPARIPPASDYGDYDMFEDGIGIVRSYVDEFDEACESGLAARAAEVLAARDLTARYIVGEAMQPFLDAMIANSPLAGRLVPLTVRNDYFGGNVNVTGLLTASDIAPAIKATSEEEEGTHQLFLLPSVIFNDNGVTLDDMTVQDIENAAGAPVSVVSCNPFDYLPEIIKLAQDES